jgi:Penicillin binding protein transpeptidase domain
MLIALAVVVVLLAASGVGYLLHTRADDQAQDRRANAAARTYLAGWQSLYTAGATAGATATATGATGVPASTAKPGDAATPASATSARARQTIGAVSEPGTATVDAAFAAMVDLGTKLRLRGARITPGQLDRHGDAATFGYTAVLLLDDLPSNYSYAGQLRLGRAGKSWKVQAALNSVQPDLTAGTHLDRTTSTGSRGRLLDSHGNPLNDDAELAGNLVGQVAPASGLQRVYNPTLSPSGGAVVLRDARNQTVRTLKTFPSASGADVHTTLDLNVQRAAEAALGSATQPNGAMVAIDTRTGGILALVNHPLNGYGRAERGAYPPGSTFKIVTATAALMAGRTAATPLDCSQNITVEGRTIQNSEAEQFGVIPLRTAFAKSCNTAFIRLAQGLPSGELAKAAKLYGFDGTRPLPIASFGGSYPTPKDTVDYVSSAIGQGKVQASPIQMASVAAAVASGTWRQPFVSGTAPRSNPIPTGVLGPLRDFMRAVVTEGTAAGVPFPGLVFGKTGTAEYKDGNPPPTDAWFVGYRGDVAFAVLIEDGGFGAQSAAPVAARFLAGLGA